MTKKDKTILECKLYQAEYERLEAIEELKNTQSKESRNKVIGGGMVVESLEELCKHFDLDTAAIKERARESFNWTKTRQSL